MEKDGSIAMASGTVPYDDYLGLAQISAFVAWKFVEVLPVNTLLCAGGELMEALGIKSEKGHLYELDPATRTGKMIA